MKALILQNAEGEGPGILADFLDRDGWDRKTVPLYAGGVIPPDWSDYDIFVAMGGPMNVYEEKAYPFLVQETALLRQAIEKKLPVLGFCLGAQLMAKARGAKVVKGHEKEIGWYPLRSTDRGMKDPLLKSFPAEFFAFQWHEDTFCLPKGAACLVSSNIYENQAMRLGPLSYGFQFHFEITKDMIVHWLESGLEEVTAMGRAASVETILKDTDRFLEQTHSLAAAFFTRYLKSVAEMNQK